MGVFQKFSFQIFFLASLLQLTQACSSSNINDGFEKKYGKEVKKIKAERVPTEQNNKEVTILTTPTPAEIESYSSSPLNYYPYADISKFGEKLPQNYLPTAEIYEQSKANNPANSLPPNIFEISYNTNPYPPFQKAGFEFDTIKIPPSDIYGVKTAMTEKPYLLAGGDSLQKSVDQINSERTAEDIEMSQALIREQKQLRHQQKMVEIFGKNSVELTSLEEEKENKKKPKAKQNLESAKAEKSADDLVKKNN